MTEKTPAAVDKVVSMLEQRASLRATIAETEGALAAIPREFTEGDPNTDPAAARQVLDRVDRSDTLAASLTVLKATEKDITGQADRLTAALAGSA